MVDPDSERGSRRRPPPNYFSRRVQTRLLLLVGAFMLVIFMMEEARKPEYYEWMWGNQLPGQDENELPASDIDTRIAPAAPTGDRPAPGTIGLANQPYDPATLEEAGRQGDDPTARASIDAWGRMLGELSLEQRDNLDLALLRRRQSAILEKDLVDDLSAAVEVLDGEFDKYVNQARESLSGNDLLEEDEIAAWQSVLDQLESAWRKKWKPALDAAGLNTGRDPALDEIQSLIDELNLAAIRDNTLSPMAERYAWSRFIERLQTEEAAQLDDESVGVVGFLQLHDQPKDYRGKVVTIRGQAKLGYRVTARNNALGIKEYQLLWLRPRGGPNTLVAVYCLETPNLPPLKHKDRDRGVTELDHEVQITGFFFKKWAYRAQDGLRTAPQILARSVVVESSPGVWSSAAAPPSNGTLAIVAIVAAIAGVGLAGFFYVLNQWPSRAADVMTRSTKKIVEIDPNQVSRGVASELRELEDAERSDEQSREFAPPDEP